MSITSIIIIAGIGLLVIFVIFPLLNIKTIKTCFGCCYSSGEDEVKKNSFLYRMYGIDTVPNFWFSLTAMDKWNSYLCKLCNTLPDGTNNLKFLKMMKISEYFSYLLFMDMFWEKKENKQVRK